MNFGLNTKAKIGIASKLYKGVHLFRGMFSAGDRAVCKRAGISWELELTEGIDLSIYLFGRFERDTSKALQALVRPGMTVLDIGANMGAHALPIASWVGEKGRVFAFEPTDWAFNRLTRNLALNPALSSLHPVQCALGDETSVMPHSFYSSWNLKKGSDKHILHGGRLQKASRSVCIPLDHFIEENAVTQVDLIKLDVDGFEVQVLRGAKDTLKKFHPVILFELCPHVLSEHGTSAEELLSLLAQVGYAFFSETGRPLKLTQNQIISSVPANGSLNLIARSS